jgi:hypothetical protein
MKRASLVLYGLAMVGLLCPGTVSGQTPAGTAFTYQGQLKENGVPVNTTSGSFRVALYDAETGGNQIGGSVLVENVRISNGLFTIPLDFGSEAFNGDARWLNISVYKTGTGWVALSPRQMVTPAPQAQFAQNAAALQLPFAGTLGWTAEDAFKLDYAGDGWVIRATSTGVDAGAIWAETTEYDTVALFGKAAGLVSVGVVGQSTATGPGSSGAGGAFMSTGQQGTGVLGLANWTTGVNYGVRGECNSPQGYGGYFLGRGYFRDNVGIGIEAPAYPLHVTTNGSRAVYAETTATTAGAIGGEFRSESTSGHGVKGRANAATGTTSGVFGEAQSTSGRGVYGWNGNPAGETYGVLGAVRSSSGYGVAGLNTADTGDAVAVFGSTSSADGRAVYGVAMATTGDCLGVQGEINSPAGAAVYAEAKATSGTANGVFAVTASTQGSGVFGQNTSPTGDNEGVNGVSWSPDGKGVIGWNGCSTGNAYGVLGRTASATGIGVFGEATQASGTNYGVYGKTSSPNGYAGYFDGRSYFSGPVGIGVSAPTQKLDVNGTVKAKGLQMVTAPTAGYVLTCDAAGVGSWLPAAGESLWQQNGSDIYYSDGNVGIGTGVETPLYPLTVRYSSTAGYFETIGTAGRAVSGAASATSGTVYGVYGSTASSAGTAVYGTNTASSGTSTGVGGRVTSASGRAIYGENAGGGWAGYFSGKGYFSGNVGIGTTSPATALDVSGTTKATGFQLTTSPTAGHVLTCDASGVGTWQEATGGLTLPYEGTLNSGSAGIHITNNGSGAGLHGQSNTGIGVKAQSSGTTVDHPAMHAQNTNANGIGIVSTTASTDANTVVVNKGSGELIKGFSGPTGGDLVFCVQNNGATSVTVLNITGGADLAEQFEVTEQTVPGTVVAIDPDQPGKLCVAHGAYNRRVAGVVSGANDLAAGMVLNDPSATLNTRPVTLTGRVWVLCDATDGPIEPGDLLTTAERPGHAMTATDPARSHGAVLGKAMTRLEKGQTGLVLVLVNLQ